MLWAVTTTYILRSPSGCQCACKTNLAFVCIAGFDTSVCSRKVRSIRFLGILLQKFFQAAHLSIKIAKVHNNATWKNRWKEYISLGFQFLYCHFWPLHSIMQPKLRRKYILVIWPVKLKGYKRAKSITTSRGRLMICPSKCRLKL